MIVTIDPGHGGSDTGAAGVDPRSGRKVYEKDLNLLLASALREQLESRCRAVFLTRDGDHDLGQLERVRIADSCRAITLISIHHNGAASPKARGFELLIDKNVASSFSSTSTPQPAKRYEDSRINSTGLNHEQLRLAESILPGVAPVLERWGIPLRNPAIKNDENDSARGHLTLLEEATVPAAIVETCFVTNPLELLAATSSAFRIQFTEALAEAVTAWAEELGID